MSYRPTEFEVNNSGGIGCDNDEDVPGAKVCEKGHKPRWYSQRNDNPYDLDYGYKRKCADYEERK